MPSSPTLSLRSRKVRRHQVTLPYSRGVTKWDVAKEYMPTCVVIERPKPTTEIVGMSAHMAITPIEIVRKIAQFVANDSDDPLVHFFLRSRELITREASLMRGTIEIPRKMIVTQPFFDMRNIVDSHSLDWQCRGVYLFAPCCTHLCVYGSHLIWRHIVNPMYTNTAAGVLGVGCCMSTHHVDATNPAHHDVEMYTCGADHLEDWRIAPTETYGSVPFIVSSDVSGIWKQHKNIGRNEVVAWYGSEGNKENAKWVLMDIEADNLVTF